MPGVSFLARKRELGYILNKFKEVYYSDVEGGARYFPETFLIPEQFEDYKRIHKVDS